MAKELCYVVEQISREKGISREVLIETLRSALLSAARKRFGGRMNIDLTIDPKNCDISVFETKKLFRWYPIKTRRSRSKTPSRFLLKQRKEI